MTDHEGGQLRALITGYEAAQCVHAAVKLGVADALGNGAHSVKGWLRCCTRMLAP